MKGDEQIVVLLNDLLEKELVAVNQYFLHAKILNHWGLYRLNKIEHKESIDEKRHADLCADRILFLEHKPIIGELNQVNIGGNIEEVLRNDLILEVNTIQSLRNSISYAYSIKDYVSSDIMLNILIDEEKHVDFLETELNILTNIGEKKYFQSQLKINI